METTRLVKIINKKGIITEREINLLKHRLQRGDSDVELDNSLNITPEQTEKGKLYILTRLAKLDGTPRNGYGAFEDLINLAKEKDSYFTFTGYEYIYLGNCIYPLIAPIYILHDGISEFAYISAPGHIQRYQF